jgi:hypothetical protein
MNNAAITFDVRFPWYSRLALRVLILNLRLIQWLLSSERFVRLRLVS